MKILKQFTIFLLVSCSSLTALANSSASAKKSHFEKVIPVNAKCYVQLVGGGETISLWLVKPSLLKSLTKSVVGQEVRVVGTKEKSTIYRAKECILEEEKFSDPNARAMDEDQPR